MIFRRQFESKSPSVMTNNVFLYEWQWNLCIRIHERSFFLAFLLEIGYKRRYSKAGGYDNPKTDQYRRDTLKDYKHITNK